MKIVTVGNNTSGIKIYFNRCLFLKSTTASFLTKSLAICPSLLKNTLLIIDLVAKLNPHSTCSIQVKSTRGAY